MAMKRSLVVVILIAALVSIAALSVAYASNPPPPDQPAYTVEQLPCGYLRVRVQVDLADRAARDHYAAQQRAEAMALAHSGIGSVPVQVTFARPLSVEELRLLAQHTGLVAEWVIFEARDVNQKQHTVAARGTGADIIDLNNLPGLDEHSLHLVGVTAVRGTVPGSASGLGQLAIDARVYVPDVTPYRLATEVAARYGVEVDKVQVSIPTPHWYISAER